jgi:prepilin-type N-terminal cleavage/methylation domain-containing protein
MIDAGRADPARSRAGFTLIEVLVALSIAGMLLLGTRALLEQLADGAERISRTAEAGDRDANAERLLRRLAAQIEAGGPDAAGFLGNERGARFATWCDVAAGWQERCTVTLGFVPVEDGVALTALLPGGELIVVRRGVRSGALRYLYSAGDGGTWLRSWESGVSTPLAMAVVLDGDTLIVRIGERG